MSVISSLYLPNYKFTSKKVDKINDSSVRQLSFKNIICAHQRTSQEAFSRLFNYHNFTYLRQLLQSIMGEKAETWLINKYYINDTTSHFHTSIVIKNHFVLIIPFCQKTTEWVFLRTFFCQPYYHCDLFSGEVCICAELLASDWSSEVTWHQYWPLIGHCWDKLSILLWSEKNKDRRST